MSTSGRDGGGGGRRWWGDRCAPSTHLAVVQLAELLDDPLLQDESLSQLLPVVLDRHLALFLLHRVVGGGDGARAHAAHAGRGLEEHAAASGGQRGACLSAGGRHCGMCGATSSVFTLL